MKIQGNHLLQIGDIFVYWRIFLIYIYIYIYIKPNRLTRLIVGIELFI